MRHPAQPGTSTRSTGVITKRALVSAGNFYLETRVKYSTIQQYYVNIVQEVPLESHGWLIVFGRYLETQLILSYSSLVRQKVVHTFHTTGYVFL
jgi:hypothetical protein